MSILEAASESASARVARADLWLEDLAWHRKMFRESRFRWTGEHVMAVVTRYTVGQLDFTRLRDLDRLHRYQVEIGDYSCQVSHAMAQRLNVARQTLSGGDSWGPTAEAVGLSELDCKTAVWFAAGTAPEERTNLNVAGVLRRLPFANPLIEAFELKQLWRLYEAAMDIIEDTWCDLTQELLQDHPVDVVVQAAGTMTEASLQARVDLARERRGGPGDRRRIPLQVF